MPPGAVGSTPLRSPQVVQQLPLVHKHVFMYLTGLGVDILRERQAHNLTGLTRQDLGTARALPSAVYARDMRADGAATPIARAIRRGGGGAAPASVLSAVMVRPAKAVADRWAKSHEMKRTQFLLHFLNLSGDAQPAL